MNGSMAGSAMPFSTGGTPVVRLKDYLYMTDRFARTRLLIGDAGLDRLQRSIVAVVGLGGVGGYAVEALARAGIGHLVLIDGDEFEPTNLNRQLMALESTLGRPKVEVAAERIAQINPDTKVTPVHALVTKDNADVLIPAEVQFAVDAIDTVDSKVHLILALRRREICMVSCMGAGNRLNPIGACITDIANTKYCPLARTVRQRLKRHGVESGVPCAYFEESTLGINKDVSQSAIEPGRKQRIQGSISYPPGILGLVAAGFIITRILEQ